VDVSTKNNSWNITSNQTQLTEVRVMLLHAKHITDIQLPAGIKERIKTTVLHRKSTG